MKPHPANIRELTALRIFAAAWVPPAHFPFLLIVLKGGDPIGAPGSIFHAVLERGYLGVDFFFALSGFVLTHVYLAAWQDRSYRPLGFLWARLARIYPMHLVTMIAVILMTNFSIRQNAGVMLAELTLTHAWHTLPWLYYLNFPSWSISAEWFAYLVFPFYAVITGLGRKRPLCFLLVSAAGAAALAYYGPLILGRPLVQIHFDYGVLRIVPSFLVGCALYTVSERWTLSLRLVRLGLMAAIIGLVLSCAAHAGDWQMLIVLWALIFLAAQRSKHEAPSLLASRPLVYLGEISYSVYMVHVPLFDFLAIHIHSSHLVLPSWGCWIAYALIFPLAAASHRWIEIPSRRFLRQIASHSWRVASLARRIRRAPGA